MAKLSVLGDGGWGTAAAMLLDGKGHEVALWSAFGDYARVLADTRENTKFLPGFPISGRITVTADAGTALDGAALAVVAIPTQFMRRTLAKIKSGARAFPPVVSLAKGLETDTLMRGTEIIRDTVGGVAVGGLFGPSHAEEVAKGLPTTVVAVAEDEAFAKEIQETFMTERFRVYTNTDLVSVELGGALKNVIAIAAGICDGLGFGDNSKAALLTRGLAEITRLGVSFGGKASTFAGLAGIGDLITTAVSPFGRNRAVGFAIGRGRRLEEILADTEQVAEGVQTTKSAVRLAAKAGIELPIAEAVHRVLFGGERPDDAIRKLMTRPPKSEEEDRCT